jgi:hypothetical protein
MELIHQNPFRILGLSITATDREISKRIGELELYAEMGKEIKYAGDEYFSSKPNRSIDSIKSAHQKIEQPSDKLFYSLFWFWENSDNTIDEMAFEELKNGNKNKAVEFWNREVSKSINSNNMSNHKNLSIYELGLSYNESEFNKDKFHNSIKLSGGVLNNGFFEEFSDKILKPKHSVDLSEIIHLFVEEINSFAKPFIGNRKSSKKTTYKEIIASFSSFPEIIQSKLVEKLTRKHIHNIEHEIEISKQGRLDDVSVANTCGIELYNNTKNDLKQICLVLSKSDLKYEFIADSLATELVDCSVAYYNEFQNSSTDPGDDSLKLNKFASSIAVGNKIKDRIEEGMPILETYVKNKPERNKNQPVQDEIDFIYAAIDDFQADPDTIKNTESLIDICRIRLEKIADELGSENSFYLDLSSRVVANATGMLVECVNSAMKKRTDYVEWERKSFRRTERPIFYTYDKLKTVVKNAWDTTGKIEKFDMSTSQQELFDENKEALKSLCKQLEIPTGSGCYIATMVYGSYESQEVIFFRNYRDRVLQHSTIGRQFIKIYYRYSPIIVKYTKSLNLIHPPIRHILDLLIKLLKGKNEI